MIFSFIWVISANYDVELGLLFFYLS